MTLRPSLRIALWSLATVVGLVVIAGIILAIGFDPDSLKPRIVAAVRETGYDGALTVEFVAPIDRTPVISSSKDIGGAGIVTGTSPLGRIWPGPTRKFIVFGTSRSDRNTGLLNNCMESCF